MFPFGRVPATGSCSGPVIGGLAGQDSFVDLCLAETLAKQRGQVMLDLIFPLSGRNIEIVFERR